MYRQNDKHIYADYFNHHARLSTAKYLVSVGDLDGYVLAYDGNAIKFVKEILVFTAISSILENINEQLMVSWFYIFHTMEVIFMAPFEIHNGNVHIVH